MPKKEDKIGALWFKQKGELSYFTGDVNGVKVVIFANGYRQTDKHPDYIVYKSQPKPEQS